MEGHMVKDTMELTWMSRHRHSHVHSNYRFMALIGDVLIVLGAIILALIGLQQLFSIALDISAQGSPLINIGRLQGVLSISMAVMILLVVVNFNKMQNPFLYGILIALLAIIGGYVGGLLSFIGACLVVMSYLLESL